MAQCTLSVPITEQYIQVFVFFKSCVKVRVQLFSCFLQSYEQHQQHGALDSLPLFPGSEHWQFRTPSQLLQPADRTDFLQQRVWSSVRGGLLWLLLITREPFLGLVKCVNLPKMICVHWYLVFEERMWNCSYIPLSTWTKTFRAELAFTHLMVPPQQKESICA